MFTLDTNILIYYFNGDQKIFNFINKNKEAVFFMPTVVITEFLSYPKLDNQSEKIFFDLIKDFVIVNLDFEIAKLAGELRRKFNLKTIDAVISASTILTDSILVTYNISDFKKVKNLKIISPQ
ncbi:MAG: nucleotide-binding protein [Candidatus Parcubacteria bacterium]|nr:MAG: nucleotide-binding protein [Candidatus Parcubacteria bacterium]